MPFVKKKVGANWRPTVLSYGLGVDSTAILLGWLRDAESRPCELKDLIIVTAHVGDEFLSTIEYVETYMLPLMRQCRVRFVQLGRKDKSSMVVLDDSRMPSRLYWNETFRVSDEHRAGGTIPQTAGSRKCSIRAKGAIIDAWLLRELGDIAFDHVLGFEANEMQRANRDKQFTRMTVSKPKRIPNRFPSYPLIDWGWNRDVCIAFIKAHLNVIWPKSACAFCPFSRGRPEVMQRFMKEPESAHLTLELEALARGLNPRAKLYMQHSAREKMDLNGLAHILKEHDRRIRLIKWAVYRVIRVFTSSGNAVRKLDILHIGSVESVNRALEKTARVERLNVARDSDGYRRAWKSRKRTAIERVRSGKSFRKRERTLPCIESFLVAAPAGAEAKVNRSFEAYYEKIIGCGSP